MQFFIVILSAVALAVSTATETPADANFFLNITAPKEGDTWVSSATHLVEWDTSLIPTPSKHDPLDSQKGTLYLAYWNKHPSGNFRLVYYKKPLAHGFPLRAGSQNVTLSSKEKYSQGNVYLLVLGGVSGYIESVNFSGNFTITKN